MKRSSAFLVSLGFFIAFILSLVLFLMSWIKFLITPVIPEKSFDYILPAGGSVRLLARDLHNLNILKHPVYFEGLAYLKGYARHLRAGEYRFKAGETPGEILRQIAEGRVLWRKITFVEGSTFSQILSQTDSNPLIVHELAGLPPIVVMIKLNLLKINIHPEGLFFPDTYNYTAGMSDKAILWQAYQLMQKNLSAAWKNRADNLPYQNDYQALIAASIIEKEAKTANDRIEIAGVIKNRLEKNMLLQMDPTVIYAMEKNGMKFYPPLKREDLKIDSFYNTYLYKGLPPTPICLPGIASIHAALHPAETKALYFVSRGDGSHQFSDTYSQQLAAIRQYEH